MGQFLQLFDAWHLIRLFGWLAYLFFSMSLVFGMLGRMSAFKKKKGLFTAIHMSSSWAGLFSTFVHIMILIIDPYQPYSIVEIFVPFAAHFEPVASALGTLALFIIIIVLFTSDVMRGQMKKSIWKWIHLMVFPAWVLMLIHGLVMGSDTSTWWGYAIYGVSATLIISLFIAKSMNHEKKPAKSPQVRRVKL